MHEHARRGHVIDKATVFPQLHDKSKSPQSSSRKTRLIAIASLRVATEMRCLAAFFELTLHEGNMLHKKVAHNDGLMLHAAFHGVARSN